VAACKHCKGCDCENASVEISVSDDSTEDPDIEVSGSAEPDDDQGNEALSNIICDTMNDDGMELAVPWLVEEVV
jgi:hypothetical protein